MPVPPIISPEDPTAPSVYCISSDDTVWVADCNLGQLASFFEDHTSWMTALNAAYQAKHPGSLIVLKLVSPIVATITTFPTTPPNSQDAVASISGIVGTSSVTIRPYRTAYSGFLQDILGKGLLPEGLNRVHMERQLSHLQDGADYWLQTLPTIPHDLLYCPETGYAGGHLQVIPQNTAGRGALLATLLCGLCSDPAYVDAMLSKNTNIKPQRLIPPSTMSRISNAAAPQYVPVSGAVFQQITLVYSTDDDTATPACEVVDSIYDPTTGNVTPSTLTTKDYAVTPGP